MKIKLSSVLVIAVAICSISNADDYILFQSGNSTGSVDKYIVDSAIIEKTPSWKITEPIPLELSKVIQLIKEEYPDFPESLMMHINLDMILSRTTPEGKRLSFDNKWFYVVSGFTSEYKPIRVVMLLDGTIIEPQLEEK